MKDIDEVVEDFEKRTKIKGLLALAKVDGDKIGELFKLITPSPSRFITLSELLQFYFGGLSYALMEYEHPRISFKDDVVVLYGGGDDIALYGSWIPLIYYLIILRQGMSEVLHPLTCSGAVIIDDPKAPIALNYEALLDHLEHYAKEFDQRNSIVLFKNPMPYVYEYDINNMSVKLRYGISYDDLSTLRKVIEGILAEKPEPGTFYELYLHSQKVSELMEKNIKLIKVRPSNRVESLRISDFVINELLILAVRLQYEYNRVLSEQERVNKVVKYIKNYNLITSKLSEGKAVEALFDINKYLITLTMLIISSRTV